MKKTCKKCGSEMEDFAIDEDQDVVDLGYCFDCWLEHTGNDEEPIASIFQDVNQNARVSG